VTYVCRCRVSSFRMPRSLLMSRLITCVSSFGMYRFSTVSVVCDMVRCIRRRWTFAECCLARLYHACCRNISPHVVSLFHSWRLVACRYLIFNFISFLSECFAPVCSLPSYAQCSTYCLLQPTSSALNTTCVKHFVEGPRGALPKC